jgi:superfamily II DNA or RNA helicase
MKFRYDKSTEELVVTSATRIEYHQLSLWLTRKIKGWRYHPAVKVGVWDGNKSYFKDGRINLGLWKEALKGCKEIEASFLVENKEDFPLNRDVTLEKVQEFCKEFFKDHKVKNKEGEWISFYPYDHQIESAYKLLKNRYSLCEVATSGGKTLIVSIVYFYTLKNMDKNAKLLVIVPSITLVTQFYDSIIDFNIGENKEFDGGNKNPLDIRIEEVMSDRPRKHLNSEDPNIYIGTYQSLSSESYDKKFFQQFHTVACDESHLAKAKTINSILEKTFKHAYSRFGVSGTFPTDDSLEILSIQSVLGPIITEVSANELKERGIITPMEINAVILNHNEVEINDRLALVRKSDGRSAYEYEKKFIHASDKRIEFICKIIEKKCTNNTLVLFHTIEHGKRIFEELRKKFPGKKIFYIDGMIKNRERNKIKEDLEIIDDNCILVGSFGCLSTGISIRNLHNLILADSFKSEQIIIQSIGRLLRLNDGKTMAVIYDLVDVFDPNNMNNALYKHYIERLKFYKKRKYPHKETKMNI